MRTAFNDDSGRPGKATPVSYTLIDIGARLTRVVAVVDAVPAATLELALGSQATAEQFFKAIPLPRTNSNAPSTRSRMK